MPQNTPNRRALVFGATGFIGRWLVRQLLLEGIDVCAAVRTAASGDTLGRWLAEHEVPLAPTYLEVDFTVDGLGIENGSRALGGISEVYNVGGAYRFGMTADEAREANVDGSRRVVELAAQLPRLTRLAHLSGYRVSGHDYDPDLWTTQNRAATYERIGAYEASKIESDATVRNRAEELGVPLTIANPATVIGDSATGESNQQIGLATSVLDLAAGKLFALPGGSDTFVPVVTVDYLARFLTLLPTSPETEGEAYWILDDQTPALPELLAHIGHHLGVKVPRLRVPVRMIRLLPTVVTRADAETLAFLSSDRYPTGPARELANRHGLEFPAVEEALTCWADRLIAHA